MADTKSPAVEAVRAVAEHTAESDAPDLAEATGYRDTVTGRLVDDRPVELDAPALRLNGYITRPQFWALDEACKPLRATFPDYGPYLVGSVMERPTFRDVDVRLIMSDEQYDRLSDAEWSLIGFVTSRHLAALTGLPIDFQVQRQTEANAAYGHRSRTPLGMRGDGFWHGDHRPEPTTVTPPDSHETRGGASLPLHRTEAGWPRCSTCDGGGCPDCTDPA